jgi:hypothetical protein
LHAAAVVDDKANTGRDIFGAEKRDVLQTILFVDVNIAALQPGYVPAPSVRDRHVKNHEVDVDSDLVFSLVLALLH